MKRTVLFILGMITIIGHACAQLTVRGTVTDPQNRPVSDVIVKLTLKGRILTFGTTDYKGHYSLSLEEIKKGTVLTFAHVSYEQEQVTLKPTDRKEIVEDMMLVQKSISLQEVRVRPNPLLLKGDTLSYNLSSFLGKGDVTLEDGLKRLPGIEVSKSGAISYMGKGISAFNIEGLNMLGGSYNLATRMHMGDVFMNYPKGRITVQEELYPYRYQTDAPFELPQWNIGYNQDSISGYSCHSAETFYRGKTWQAYYTEEVPSSIGPWKLAGLPGLIITAKDKEGIHSFTLCGLLNEEQPLIFTEYITWIVPERSADGKMNFVKQRVDYQKMKADKFRKHKAKLLGNSRYVQNPTYYAPDAMNTFGYQETRHSRISDNTFNTVAGVVIPTTVNAFQPLELK